MARAPEVPEAILALADALAQAIKRRYMQGGGSEGDWETDLSYLVKDLHDPYIINLMHGSTGAPVAPRKYCGSVRLPRPS